MANPASLLGTSSGTPDHAGVCRNKTRTLMQEKMQCFCHVPSTASVVTNIVVHSVYALDMIQVDRGPSVSRHSLMSPCFASRISCRANAFTAAIRRNVNCSMSLTILITKPGLCPLKYYFPAVNFRRFIFNTKYATRHSVPSYNTTLKIHLF